MADKLELPARGDGDVESIADERADAQVTPDQLERGLLVGKPYDEHAEVFLWVFLRGLSLTCWFIKRDRHQKTCTPHTSFFDICEIGKDTKVE
ncbi:MAG: hypothetical protein ACERJ1_09490 [Halodesulfovibrio sp.]|uniref:hypothetical protein n=1 Tax=Halodesulfovibrio sp. TaxID=1912772 RepID=UPI00359D813F